MSFLDIILGGLLIYSLVKGIHNGLFTELASFVSLLLGVYLAIKFSYIIRVFVTSHVSWSPKTVEIVAFGFTFFAIVFGIHLLAKFFTGLFSFAHLGWINRFAGASFSVLKTVMMLSVVFNLFQKININNILVKESTLNNSKFYNPIQKTAQFFYPKFETWYKEVKNRKKIEQSDSEISK
jgi:membrane protein required for colicin V production